jgi:SM-20-related protein
VDDVKNDFLWDQIADALVDPGYLVLDTVMPDDLVKGLLVRLGQLENEGMKPAGIGRGQDFHQDQQVRGDHIQWLSDDNSQETAFLFWMDQLRQALNQRLFLGLVDYESHFAVYPAGSFYQKHLDAFREQPTSGPKRKVSSVFYLNPDWKLVNAGELVLYNETSDQILETIAPECGRLVLFMSDKFPHEVKAALQNRRSIAGWFRSR